MSHLATKINYDDIYYDPSNPGSFSSVANLRRAAEKDIDLRKQPINDYLKSNIVYNLHKPARRRFNRNPTVADFPNQYWQLDLVDMRSYTKDNDGYCHILTGIDVFSKIGFAVPLKTKTAGEVASAVKVLFEKYDPPSMIQTDRGTEFQNEKVRKVCNKYGTKIFPTWNTDIKASVVERFNRTLKGRMFKYFTASGKYRYVDILDDLIDAYNSAYHTSIKMTPIEARSADPNLVFFNLYGYNNRRDMIQNQKRSRPKFKVGDWVRTKYDVSVMDKRFFPNWSDLLFKIIKISWTGKYPRYIVRDELGRRINRKYYDNELSFVDRTKSVARIERIIKKDHQKKRALVKWINAPNEMNSWIPLDQAMQATILPARKNQSSKG